MLRNTITNDPHATYQQLHQKYENNYQEAVVSVSFMLIAILLFSGGVMAQKDISFCGKPNIKWLADAANLFIQLSIWVTPVAAIVTYYGTNAIEAAPVKKETRKKLKNVRGRALKAMLKAFLAGPVIWLILTQSGIKLGSCIDIVPFV